MQVKENAVLLSEDKNIKENSTGNFYTLWREFRGMSEIYY